MNITNHKRGFSLAEAIIGIGLATVLILSIIAVSTAALSGDQKAEMRQMALTLADSELNRFSKAVGVSGTAARNEFWGYTPLAGPYEGAGTRPTLKSGNTEFALTYRFETLQNATSGADLGEEQPNNRVRKVDLTVAWWNGEEGKPGYGQLFVRSTRLVRESDVREN